LCQTYRKKNFFLADDNFINRHKINDKEFLSKRKLPFKIQFLFFCNFLKASIQLELNSFFKIINKHNIPSQFVSSGAFTKARKKLKYTAFTEINDIVIDDFYLYNNYKTWNGFKYKEYTKY